MTVPHYLHYQSVLGAGCRYFPPGLHLPLTPVTLKRAATSFAAWWTKARWVWTVCCDLKPGPTAPESSTLTTRLPSCPTRLIVCADPEYCLTRMSRKWSVCVLWNVKSWLVAQYCSEFGAPAVLSNFLWLCYVILFCVVSFMLKWVTVQSVCLSGEQLDFNMSIQLGRSSTYPCFILYIMSKLDQIYKWYPFKPST